MGEAFGKLEWRLSSSHLGGIQISLRWVSRSFTEEEKRKRENSRQRRSRCRLEKFLKTKISHGQETKTSSSALTETSGSSINYGSGKETSDNTQERSAKKTVDAAIQTSADVTVLKDQKESAKTVSQTSALKVPSHKYPTRTKLAGRSSGKLQPAILSPVPTSSTSAYREERAISVLRPGLGSSSTPCTDTRTSNEEANDRRSSGSKFVSSEIAEGISAQIVSALVQSLKMNIPTIS